MSGRKNDAAGRSHTFAGVEIYHEVLQLEGYSMVLLGFLVVAYPHFRQRRARKGC